MHPFINSHSDEWFELWKLDKATVAAPDLATFFEHMAKPMIRDAVFGFVKAWWPLRHEPNVLLMNFADMKRDHEGSVRRGCEAAHPNRHPGPERSRPPIR